MDVSRSKLLCPINSLTIRNTLLIPYEFTQMSNEYNEEDILRFFQHRSKSNRNRTPHDCRFPITEEFLVYF